MALVLDLAAGMVIADEVGGVVFTKNGEGLFKLVLFYVAVGSKVTTGGASRNEILAGEKGQGACEVVIREVYLSQPKRVGITVFANKSVSLMLLSSWLDTVLVFLTGKCQDFVPNVDCGIMLATV